MKKIVFGMIALLPLIASAQVQWMDDFSDGDFTANPPWTGNTGSWMVNAAGQLQSTNQVANSSFYLCTPSTAALGVEWVFDVRLGFNTSSSNYVDVFVVSSAADVTGAATSGYFIRLGNTQDEISLYRKDGPLITRLIDGQDGTTGGSDNSFRIRLVRTAGGQFSLYRDASGTGNNFVVEGSATDNTYTASAYFGFLVRQSTSSFFGRHYFDEINVRPYVPDITPPVLVKALATSEREADIYFSEPVDAATAQTLSNYIINNGIGQPVLVQLSGADHRLVHAVFGHDFFSGTSYTLQASGIRDLAGNVMTASNVVFDYYRAQRYDIIIDEIMADPSPPVGLPNAEYVELRNRSGHELDIGGWHLATETASSAAFPYYRLPPDSFVLLTGASQAALLSRYGPVLAVPNFPALDNEAALLNLSAPDGRTIHAVAYNSGWYDSPVKKAGGWSLEMIDVNNPCSGQSNWKESIDAQGGTPGRKNSVDGNHPDQSPPQAVRAYAADSLTIIVLFDEPLDSTDAAQPNHYSLDGYTITIAHPLPPLFNTIALSLSSPLQKGQIYPLQLSNLSDCRGNRSSSTSLRVGLTEPAAVNDLVINEILFDPPPGLPDFVELYNRGNKIIDAQHLYLANRNSMRQVASLQKISEMPLPIFPGDYLLLTSGLSSLRRHYLVMGNIAELATLPSFPDDTGTVVLANEQGLIVDEVAYSSKWQFALITNPQGVSLERLDPSASSQDRSNWHSAASTAGYATPGYKNSQYLSLSELPMQLEIQPRICSPDNDGRDDAITIGYTADAPGYVANITVFDARGRPVRQLIKNELLGRKGRWLWDGLDDRRQQLPAGAYIIYAELFNLQGKRKIFKEVVVLVRSGG